MCSYSCKNCIVQKKVEMKSIVGLLNSKLKSKSNNLTSMEIEISAEEGPTTQT